MASLDLVRRHVLAAVALAGLLVGGIAGLFFPIRAAPLSKSSSDAWVLPSVNETKRYHDNDFTALRNARFWNEVAGPGQRTAPAVDWGLSAIVTRPRPMAVVSKKGSASSTLVALGAELPDGSTLVRLTRDAIWFDKDDCRRERRLYRPVTTENNACLESVVPATSKTPADSTPTAAPEQPDSGPARPTTPAAPTPPAAGSKTP